jgi:hypothetical protein
MYKRIPVAHNESPEASRALTSANRLARMLGAELRAVTILESPPSYTAFAGAADPSLTLIINSDRMQAYERFAVRGPPGRQAALSKESNLRSILWKARRYTPSFASSLTIKQIFS